MRLRSLLLAAALFAATIPSLATPQPIDATDLWISPDESGWGLNVVHQGDTLFGSLFVYGPDGQPKWYTASSLTGGPFVFSGPLTESTGPWLGAGTFDPGRVTRRTVGTMTLTIGEADASVNYTVDGVQVSKSVKRFSMRPINIGGAYYGVMLQPARGGSAEISRPDQHIIIQDGDATVMMYTDSNTTSSCSFTGTRRTQNGEMVTVGGTSGTPGGFSGCGDWSMTIDPTPNGFTGNFSGHGITDGRISASRRGAPVMTGSGWANDLWFPRNEGGWGVNIIEQGDSMFATLFVYDAQGRPRWYSASQLLRNTTYADPTWHGALYESTGPYFGTLFNAAAVTRRQVGTMDFSVHDDGYASLGYTVDGVTVGRSVSRFAFRKNDLTGSYKGMLVRREDDPRGRSYDDAEMTIDDRNDSFVMNMNIFTGPKCTYTGPSLQNGSLRSVAGTYACQGGATGTFKMDNITVSANGFTATYQGPAGHISGLITNGHLSGARR